MASSNGKRPKGYIDGWQPQAKTVRLLGQVQSVLDEYHAQLPLTARQIFYRLVGQYNYDKTEQAYSRLCEALVKARRAQIIPFEAIRDDGTVERGGQGWGSVAEWWRSQLTQAKYFTRDHTDGQPYDIEVWCEAAGMVPQLVRVANPYDVTVYSTGGFSSVTVTYEVAQRVISRDRPTAFLHIGDYDPSGESIFESMTEDINAFVLDETGDDELFLPARVALTREQVEEHDLPTAPPKRSDSRSARWVGETCQAEAMDPATLADTLERAIVALVDEEQLADVLEVEREERTQLVADVEKILEERRS